MVLCIPGYTNDALIGFLQRSKDTSPTCTADGKFKKNHLCPFLLPANPQHIKINLSKYHLRLFFLPLAPSGEKEEKAIEWQPAWNVSEDKTDCVSTENPLNQCKTYKTVSINCLQRMACCLHRNVASYIEILHDFVKTPLTSLKHLWWARLYNSCLW